MPPTFFFAVFGCLFIVIIIIMKVEEILEARKYQGHIVHPGKDTFTFANLETALRESPHVLVMQKDVNEFVIVHRRLDRLYVLYTAGTDLLFKSYAVNAFFDDVCAKQSSVPVWEWRHRGFNERALSRKTYPCTSRLRRIYNDMWIPPVLVNNFLKSYSTGG